MSAKALILLRTHFVDARVAELARRYAANGEYDVKIALDETLGEIDAHGLPKLSLTLDSCARFGLEVGFDKPLWRCGDYLFYHALAHAPGYERYWSVEYDVAVNFSDPVDFFRLIDLRAREDYLTALLEPAATDWPWRRAAAQRFGAVYSSGFFLVRLSSDAIAKLFARRRYEAKALRAAGREPQAHWPNDEAFVSSAASELGLGMADFNAHGEFYTRETLSRQGVWHIDQLPPPDGKIYHSVRSGDAYLTAARSYYEHELDAFFRYADRDAPEFASVASELLARRLGETPDDPVSVFAGAGPLADLREPLGDPRVAAALMRALARRRLRLCLEALQFARLETPVAHTPAHDNVALARPAWQSSRSARSRGGTVRQDAEFGNDGDIDVEYGFHTGYQHEPWWAVDLGDEHPLRLVRLYNRPHSEHRLKNFVVETSNDFVSWRTLFVHDPADMRALRARPVEIVVEPALPARYLRVRLARTGVLHLAEVEALKASA